MILVTGTKRSGTSMWMQSLQAAGLEVLGSAFPRVWEESIKEANPRGFFESRFRNGIFYRTNPDPKTGRFLHPKPSRKVAVKVFIPGLVRSDMAFLHRVIGSVRPWRAYSASLRRLYAMEDRWLEAKEQRLAQEEKQDSSRKRKIAHELEWVRSSPKARQAKSKARITAFESLVGRCDRGVGLHGFVCVCRLLGLRAAAGVAPLAARGR